MREILFRGQTRKKGEKVRLDGSPVDGNWVYGGVNQGEGDHSIIYQTEPEFQKYPVYSDTLGQYTGLTDKNGKKIFEGDIVRYSYDYPDSPFIKAEGKTNEDIIYRTGDVFWSEWRGTWAVGTRVGKHAMNQDLYVYVRNPNRVEIIGNIHDNPELLKGGEQE